MTAILENKYGFTKTVVLPMLNPIIKVPIFDNEPTQVTTIEEFNKPLETKELRFKFSHWLNKEYEVALYTEI